MVMPNVNPAWLDQIDSTKPNMARNHIGASLLELNNPSGEIVESLDRIILESKILLIKKREVEYKCGNYSGG